MIIYDRKALIASDESKTLELKKGTGGMTVNFKFLGQSVSIGPTHEVAPKPTD